MVHQEPHHAVGGPARIGRCTDHGDALRSSQRIERTRGIEHGHRAGTLLEVEHVPRPGTLLSAHRARAARARSGRWPARPVPPGTLLRAQETASRS